MFTYHFNSRLCHCNRVQQSPIALVLPMNKLIKPLWIWLHSTNNCKLKQSLNGKTSKSAVPLKSGATALYSTNKNLKFYVFFNKAWNLWRIVLYYIYFEQGSYRWLQNVLTNPHQLIDIRPLLSWFESHVKSTTKVTWSQPLP